MPLLPTPCQPQVQFDQTYSGETQANAACDTGLKSAKLECEREIGKGDGFAV